MRAWKKADTWARSCSRFGTRESGGGGMTGKLVLHEYSASGNCYKGGLTAALVGKPPDRRGYDIMQGETRTPEFLKNVSPNGRIPVLPGGRRFSPQSHPASYFLSEG